MSQIERLKELSRMGVNIDRGLIWAAETGDLEMMRIVTENNKNITKKILNEALRVASRRGFVALLKALLELGADVHDSDDEGLRTAASRGDLEVAQLFLEWGADIHAMDDEALRIASAYGELEVVRLFLEWGADVHAMHDGAVRWAAEHGNVDIVRVLAGHGADVHALDNNALALAAHGDHYEMVQVLVDEYDSRLSYLQLDGIPDGRCKEYIEGAANRFTKSAAKMGTRVEP